MIPALTDALSSRGYETLTAVQEAVSDPALVGHDLLVSAQTGSGKTVGFGLAIAPTLLGEAERFGPAGAPMALIVAPTRELALQVKAELTWLYAETGALLASCVGGMDIRTERRALERGAHIVVGTPGRLRDHIERGALDMGSLRAIVLDEADEMLDLGFREDLEFMLGQAPEDRRILLFSATVPPSIAALAETYQRDARRINTTTGAPQHADIAYSAVRVAQGQAEHAIFNLLRFHHDAGAIVFANTRAAVNHLTARLSNRGLATVSLSGELSQTERTHALQAMRDGRARVCVATDVAARGIDLPNLSLVIHADLPTNTESLLHRSGRTGRAGRKGSSVLIVPPKAMGKATRILKWAKITAEWTEAPTAEAILRADEDRLMTDPAWDEEMTEEDAAFAARLLEGRDPQTVAAFCLRLFRARHAAPEDLSPPDAAPAHGAERAPRPERAEFGPSAWISLSVGAGDRAEARWLLPVLMRAGQLDKGDIGAIRVRDAETFVEVKAGAIDGFFAGLDGAGTLEDGLTARRLDAAPDLDSAPRPAGRPTGPRPARRDDDRAPRPAHRGDDRPARTHRDGPAKPHGSKPGGAKPYGAKPGGPKPYGAKPAGKRSNDAPPAAKPYGAKPYSGKPAGAKPYAGKPAGARPAGDRPARDDAPAGKPYAGKAGGKPYGDKPAGKPYTGKPGAKPYGGKPGGDGARGGKPAYGKPAGPARDGAPKRSKWADGAGDGAPRGKGRPDAKPARPPANAADTSKRFSPKPGGAARPRTGPGGGKPPPRGGKR